MKKRKQRNKKNENLVNFTVRIPSTSKQRLIDYSNKTKQSQALIISDLIRDHIPAQSVTLAPAPFPIEASTDDFKQEIKDWLTNHEKD
jgi:hypothetical protein